MSKEEASNKIRIIIVGGIRTHFIKINAIQKVFEKLPDKLKDRFKIYYVNVGQHYDYALTCHIESLGVHFDYSFNHKSKEPYNILVSIFDQFGKLLDLLGNSQNIDYVVVMGDVATTAVTALAAISKSIKVVHIEGGVRIKRGKGNEEYYRTIADHSSTLCFTSTHDDYTNLINEGLKERAFFSGDIMYDYVKNFCKHRVFSDFKYIIDNKLKSYKIGEKPYILSSLHHVENINIDLLQNLFNVFGDINYESVFIAHPRIKNFILENKIDSKKTLVVDGIPYKENLKAISGSAFCFADSGGIQREAYYLDKRCIVCSDLTIWRSIINTGSNMHIGKTIEEIRWGVRWAESKMSMPFKYNGCFGTGQAVRIIFETILKHYETI